MIARRPSVKPTTSGTVFELLAACVSVGAAESVGIVEVAVEVIQGRAEASSSPRILLDQREAMNEQRVRSSLIDY